MKKLKMIVLSRMPISEKQLFNLIFVLGSFWKRDTVKRNNTNNRKCNTFQWDRGSTSNNHVISADFYGNI